MKLPKPRSNRTSKTAPKAWGELTIWIYERKKASGVTKEDLTDLDIASLSINGI